MWRVEVFGNSLLQVSRNGRSKQLDSKRDIYATKAFGKKNTVDERTGVYHSLTISKNNMTLTKTTLLHMKLSKWWIDSLFIR